jgi:hypothetical protein
LLQWGTSEQLTYQSLRGLPFLKPYFFDNRFQPMNQLLLSHISKGFVLDDKHGHTKLKIHQLRHRSGLSLAHLRLEVLDQNELVLFSKPLTDYLQADIGTSVAILKEEVAIYNHLTVRLMANDWIPIGMPMEFEAELQYETR